MQAARATGADVPVCLDPRPRIMRGIGDILSKPIELPRLAVVLINPGTMVPTKDVFRSLRVRDSSTTAASVVGTACSGDVHEFIAQVAGFGNDLEVPAMELAPVIADVLAALRSLPGCGLARMSGSGATCFGLFESHSKSRGGRGQAARRACVLVGARNYAWRIERYSMIPLSGLNSIGKYRTQRFPPALLSSRSEGKGKRIGCDRAIMTRALNRVLKRAMLDHQVHRVFEIGIGRL